MKRLTYVLFGIIFITAVLVRLYGVGNPIADWHSWRQNDTAAVARNFGKFGFDPFHPRFDDLSNIPSGKDNPMGWRMVEFPLYQSVAWGVHAFAAQVPIEIILRLVTIAASVGTLALVYLLLSSTVGAFAATIGALVYALLPYSVFFGRIILPEPFMMFWAVLSVYLLYRGDKGEKGNKGGWGNIVLAGVSGAVALLVKPTAIFLLLPVPYLLFRRLGVSWHLITGLFVYWIIGLFPLWWWRGWILQFPEGIPVYAWLFNEGNIRFKGAWFYWLFDKRIGELILGVWGLIPFGIGGLLVPSKKEGWLFRLWAMGALLYMIVIARGNVQHDYYQILLLPIIAVYAGKGFAFLLSNTIFSRPICYLLTAVSFLMMLAFSWYTIRSYYWINRPDIVEAGREADRLLPKEAKVIAPYNGDTTFLYQTNRQGWPLGFDIEKKLSMGATHYVTVSPTDNDWETRDLANQYTVLVRNDRYAIIDLTKPKL